jgi:hypothetical protein
MLQDRLHQIRRGFADRTSQGDGPVNLGPLRALAGAWIATGRKPGGRGSAE